MGVVAVAKFGDVIQTCLWLTAEAMVTNIWVFVVKISYNLAYIGGKPLFLSAGVFWDWPI